MSTTFQLVLDLVARREVRISSHGYDELAEDGILATDVMAGVRDAKVLEDYPAYPKGPCVLVLQWDSENQPLHVLWGIPRGVSTPAVMITAYRPAVDRWTDDFMKRKP